MQIEVNQEQLNDIVDRLSYIKNGATKAMYRALNKTASKVRTSASTEIRKQVRLSASDVREKLTLWKANSNSLSASIKANKRGLLFYNFVTNYGNAQKGRPKTPIRVKIKPDGATIVLNKAFYIRTLNSNILTPAVNVGGKLKVLFGPSVSQVFTTVKDDIAPDANEILRNNLQHETEWLIFKNPPPAGDGSDEE